MSVAVQTTRRWSNDPDDYLDAVHGDLVEEIKRFVDHKPNDLDTDFAKELQAMIDEYCRIEAEKRAGVYREPVV